MYVTAEKIVFGGKALARTEGKTIFIPFALPGETLDITIIKNKSDYAEAVINRIIEPSPYRVVPRCPYFMQCGGCNLQMAHSEYQKTLRKAMVEELLTRAAVTAEQEPTVHFGSAWEYRNRFQFHVDHAGKIGMHRTGSNAIIAVNDCPIAHPLIRALLSDSEAKRSLIKKGVPKRFHVFAQDTLYTPHNPDASVHIGSSVLQFSTLGFFQSNIEMLEKLIPAVCSLEKSHRILDFYAGCGTFSAFLTGIADELHLVEHNRSALMQAEHNLKRIQAENYTDCTYFFHAVSDEHWHTLPASRLSYDAVIVDPPRQGMHPNLFPYLANADIPCIHYVSCNPATFVRDAKKLLACGYRFIQWKLFDFYPQTHHGELLGIFKK
ncbi:MAG: class I SAM-dependent RNA methyltransferase [Treponema sp.]